MKRWLASRYLAGLGGGWAHNATQAWTGRRGGEP